MSDTATLSRLFSSIEADVELVDRTFQERATSGLEILNSAAAHALSSPGKRLRTALTLLSGKMVTYHFERLLPLSVAFEMVHLSTLIHDDVIDTASTRRGIPTVNARYGDHIAILLGDYFFAKTAGLIADVEDFRIDRLFSDTVASVCEGSIIELMSARRLDLSMEAYLQRISYKTAALFAACCKGGATVGSASDEQIELLRQYGQSLGMAFQIVDDVLDYAGTELATGKPVGNDLCQGLVTLPLIYALQDERNGQAEFIARLLEAPEQHREEIAEVVRWVNEGPAVDRALALAHEYAGQAREAITSFRPSSTREVLEHVIDFVIARDR